jgi:hypothetical protein
MATVKVEDYRRRDDTAEGWEVVVTSYRLGGTWVCEVANASPGARLVRVEAQSRERAEHEAQEQASRKLARTRVLD